MQNKAKAKKTNTIKVSKKGEAANKSGGSMSGKGQTGGQSCIEPNGQKVKKIQDGNNKKRKRIHHALPEIRLFVLTRDIRRLRKSEKVTIFIPEMRKQKKPGLRRLQRYSSQ